MKVEPWIGRTKVKPSCQEQGMPIHSLGPDAEAGPGAKRDGSAGPVTALSEGVGAPKVLVPAEPPLQAPLQRAGGGVAADVEEPSLKPGVLDHGGLGADPGNVETSEVKLRILKALGGYKTSS